MSSAVYDLGRIVKKSVEKQNMLAWQYSTIGVSDGITMGGEGTAPLLFLPLKSATRETETLLALFSC